MFDQFINPGTMAAGAALVSVPIIIHLINRMRFRKIKWAAMEFLLKAQKRMRRKLIIEQLLLLFLRCLLVFLIGALLGRYLGFGFQNKETRPTAHLVILDDTPSMADFWRAGEGETNAFEQAKAQITEKIAPATLQATTAQSMQILTLSELDRPHTVERLNGPEIDNLKAHLQSYKTSNIRVTLAEGLRAGKKLLDQKDDKTTAKMLHIVTDLRAGDWAQDADAVKELTDEMARSGIKIHLIDVAFPYRRDDKKVPMASDNIGIIEFRPTAPVAAKYQSVPFKLRVKNFGSTDLKDVVIRFRINGVDNNLIESKPIPTLGPGQEQTVMVPVQVDRTGTIERPLDRFNLVTAVLDTPETGGLKADNVRHAVIECRDRLKVLIVEGRESSPEDKTGDGFYLRKLIPNPKFGAYDWISLRPEKLATEDLKQYSTIYLLDVPSPSEAAVKKLESFVRDGGGLGIFLGSKIRPQDYTKLLYNNGNGLLPVPLPDAPSEPLKDEERIMRNSVLAEQILLRNAARKSHPAISSLYNNDQGQADFDTERRLRRQFMLTSIDRHWPVKRIGRWRDDTAVDELFCLPNSQPTAAFEKQVVEILTGLQKELKEPKNEKYRAVFTARTSPTDGPLLEKIRTVAGQDYPLSLLASLLDQLLCDQIKDDDNGPIIREFWSQPELVGLRDNAQRLRDSVKYGDPLYLVKRFGNGRVALMTTDAGGTHADGLWTEWPTQGSWVVVLEGMQRYLAGGGSEENRTVGSPVEETLDATQYGDTVARTFVTWDPTKVKQGDPTSGYEVEDLKTQTLTNKDGRLTFRFADTRRPGVYIFTFTRLPDKPEYRALEFNIDALNEGDLRRANSDEIKQIAPAARLHSPDDASWTDELKQKMTDLSSNRWIYLVILLVLIAEQAMAVRLSFHSGAHDLELHAPSAAAAYHRGTGRPAETADEPEAAGVA